MEHNNSIVKTIDPKIVDTSKILCINIVLYNITSVSTSINIPGRSSSASLYIAFYTCNIISRVLD